MYLSDEQKYWIQLICDGKIKDVTSFIELNSTWFDEKAYTGEQIYSGLKVQDKHENVCNMQIVLNQGDRYYSLKDDEIKIMRSINYFVDLWNRLESNNLIIEKETEYNFPRLRIFNDTENKHICNVYQRILDIFGKKINYRIIPQPKLDGFIERGYLTEEEYSQQAELKQRDEQFKIQMGLANEETNKADRHRKISLYVSIGIAVISIFTSLFTVLFQYYTRDSSRKVHIENWNNKLDTMKVIIVKDSTLCLPKSPKVEASPAIIHNND